MFDITTSVLYLYFFISLLFLMHYLALLLVLHHYFNAEADHMGPRWQGLQTMAQMALRLIANQVGPTTSTLKTAGNWH